MDIARLSIAVDSSDMARAESKMDSMAAKGAKLERAFLAMGAALGLGAVMQQFLAVNTEFQRLAASLETVTGSAEGARRAFSQIQDFAKSTPFEVAEVTQAFIDLRTRGLDASKLSMTALGDYASSFGRSMTDMVRAISGVVMGETEAIKSFGVTAIAMGDKMALTFRGHTTLVGKNASEIQAYFNRLSQENFAGGMERQMKTLGGAWSNLKDQVAATFFEMGNAGASQAIVGAILSMTKALADVTPALASFSNSVVTGIGRALDIMNQLKMVILAIAAVGFAVMINGWAAALSGFVVVTRAALLATLAQNAATGSYIVLSNFAAIGTKAWAAAMAFMSSAGGVVIVVLAAMALAAKAYTSETDRLNAAVAEQEDRFARLTKPILDARDRVFELKEENKRLEQVLGGAKGIKLRLTEGDLLVKQISKEVGVTKEQIDFAKTTAKRMDEEAEKRDALTKKLEAQNKAVKDAAEEAKRQMEARKGFLRGLKEEVASLGLKGVLQDAEKARLIGISVVEGSLVKALLLKKAAFTAWADAQNQQAERDKARMEAGNAALNEARDLVGQLREGYNPLGVQAEKYQKALEAIALVEARDSVTSAEALAMRQAAWEQLTASGQEYLATVQQMKQDVATLNQDHEDPAEKQAKAEARLLIMHQKLGLSASAYRAELAKVRIEGNYAFQVLQEGAVGFSNAAGEAFGRFVTGAKVGFRDLVADMVAQLARAQAQKGFMQLINWGIDAWLGSKTPAAQGGGGGTVNLSGGGNGWNFGDPVKSSAAPPSSGATTSIVVNIANNGSTQADSKQSGESAVNLARMVKATCTEWAIQEQRQGGMLARS